MERSQKKIHRKDELTWPAHILTCSPYVLSHVLALNGTSLLAVTCPCKNQAGWPFWCPYRNVVFSSLEPCTGKPTLKSHRSKLGLRSTSSNANINMKKFARKKCRKVFLEAIFSHLRKLFSKLQHKIFVIILRDIIFSESPYCFSVNHNPEFRRVICTGVTLFALVLHLNCTALSQSESSNFFMCIIKLVKIF